MRKLKTLLSHYPIYNTAVATLASDGIATDLSLLKANLHALSSRTGIPPQLLRALRYKVAALSAVPETEKSFESTCFSTGFDTLDRVLFGGLSLGQTIEVTGLARMTNTHFSLYAIESFLHAFEDATVHYIYTTGMVDSRQLEAVISRAQAKHGRHSDHIMQRIRCYNAFTPLDASQVLVQIGALNLSSSTPSLIVIGDIVHLLEAEWENGANRQSKLASSIKSLNALGLSIIVLHTITGDPKFEHPRSLAVQGLIEQWNDIIDIRLLMANDRHHMTGSVCKVVKARTKVMDPVPAVQLSW